MPTLESRLAPFRTRLTELVQQYNVPGASLAIGRGDEIFVAAAGIANLNTGLPVVADTKFQIGSNTKVMTATLIMQLVDEGRIDLDATVQTYLPNFALADEGAAKQITLRHLLTHTSGIHGDYFKDFGREVDATEKYVDSLSEIGLLHPVDEHWSYCNAGWVVLGRILEVLHDKDYMQILRENLFTPLGMNNVALLAEEAVLGHNAVGHLPRKEGGLQVTPTYLLPSSMAAAGAIANMTAHNLVLFGLAHLHGGKAGAGTQVLSDQSVAAMQEPGVSTGQFPGTSRMGLGWMTDVRGDHRIIRHGGGTSGQLSMFHCLPDHDLVFAVLTNGPAGPKVSRIISDEIGADLVDLQATPQPVVAETTDNFDLAPLCGIYESLTARTTLSIKDGELIANTEPIIDPDANTSVDDLVKGPDAEPMPAWKLVPIDATNFVVEIPDAPDSDPVVVSCLDVGDDGHAAYLQVGARLSRRVDA